MVRDGCVYTTYHIKEDTMSIRITNHGEAYTLSCYIGVDGKYHVSFMPVSMFNKRSCDLVFNSASGAEECFKKNVLFYTGKEYQDD